MNATRTLSRTLSILLLAAATSALAAPDLDWQPAAAPPIAAVEDVQGLTGEREGWLITTAYGLALVRDGRSTLLQSGRFESIDLRGPVTLEGEQVTLVSVVDIDAAGIAVFALSLGETRAQLRPLSTITLDRDIPETQCLYRDRTQGHISLFIGDTRGRVEQRYLYDARRQRLVDMPLRRFVGVTDAAACVVDDRSGALYLAESSLGVWRMGADAESASGRVPVLLRAPHGDLEGAIGDLALDDSGQLWALDADNGVVHGISSTGQTLRETIPDVGDVQTLTTALIDSRPFLALYDEARKGLLAARLKPGGSPGVVSTDRAAMLSARLETTPVERFGDAADDPVVWVDARNAKRSVIIGTDKRAGLAVYGLDGRRRQFLPIGRLNNVDVIYGAKLGGKTLDLAAASNRSNDNISLFSIAGGELKHLGNLPTGLRDVYGLCAYRSRRDGAAYVFINSTNGRYEQYRLAMERGRPSAELVRSFTLPSQPEGCAIDTWTDTLYLGEEGGGIWRAGAAPDAAEPERIIELGRGLVADVEGIDIYRDERDAYLVVSSQGNDSFLVYRIVEDYPLLTRFQVRADLAAGIDGVSETDGLAVSSARLPGFPLGLLVVQDGRNRLPDAPQNFKVLDWRDIADLL